MVLIAGAMIVDTMMRLNPVAERTSVTVHFFVVGQFLGLGWSGGSQLRCFTRRGFGDLDNSLVGVERLFKADQERIVSSLVRFGPGRCQFNANDGFGIGRVRNRFITGLGCGCPHVLDR